MATGRIFAVGGGTSAVGSAPPSVRELEDRAHVLRRITFGPFPGGTEASLDAHPDVQDLIDAQVAAPPLPFEPPETLDRPFRVGDTKVFASEKITNQGLVRFWFGRMMDDDAGLHEKLMWFWHTVFTTSGAMGTDLYLWRQLRTIHQHAMGNLRDLAKALVIDPAMMQFLNSDASLASHPNENLARELMELFLMGRGHYTEADVRAAAYGLAGWRIDFEANVARPDPAQIALLPTSTFLGKAKVWDPDSLVDQILTKDAVAIHIVKKLWHAFIGTAPDLDLVHTWADGFRRSDYEIAPLVHTMLRSRTFLASQRTRPRSGVEWLSTVLRVLPQPPDPQSLSLDQIKVDQLGQVPYFPPNVAGWPDDSEWLSSSTGLTRATYLTALKASQEDVGEARRVDEGLVRAGIFAASAQTRAALDRLNRSLEGEEAHRYDNVLRAIALTPEFVLA